MNVLRRLGTLIGKAARYNLIKGAAVIMVLKAVLQTTGYQPWTPEQNAAVEVVVDFLVGVMVLTGVGQAHESSPTATS
jgi:hypothetical protein